MVSEDGLFFETLYTQLFNKIKAQQLQHIQHVQMDYKDTIVLPKHKTLIVDWKSRHIVLL